MLLGMKKKSYGEKLEILDLPTLVFHKIRDLIMTCKLITGKNKNTEDNTFAFIDNDRTRSHNLKVQKIDVDWMGLGYLQIELVSGGTVYQMRL